MTIEIQKRAKELVNDLVFQKPIQEIDYSKQGSLTLVTKISKLISNKK